ncbi:cobalt-factor II C(20)-methyltransferase [Halorhabdus rudnickae]|uniref:cobalt-factor II C(20)-methyltransferase n=1 Tax=Halorhabdus rudnickae TaxID=1775544 RepID=UPI0010824EED|nr:cobalt-factor II C(20)-methyltransferase [Halorhabdus rudnickae]
MTLYGVGLGPGDPALITVRGREIVTGATTVFTPGDIAECLVDPYTERTERLTFPMTDDQAALEAAWEDAAARVAEVAREDDAAFVTVGDPKIYATFGHLERALADYPAVEVRTVPGVSVVTAFTTALDVKIDEGSLTVCEAAAGIPSDRPEQLLLLKVTDVAETHDTLTEAGYTVTYGRRLFMDDATITTDPDALADSDYFTVAYAERADGGRSP